ncbi:MAG TPA: lytic transglycosylase domain-containing protein [Gemmatimonadaceae bacterium]
MSLVHRLIDEDSTVAQRPSTLVKAIAAEAPGRSGVVASAGGLDNGIQHERIDFWVKRLTTTLSSSFETALGRKDKYSDMIGAKLAARQMPRDLIYLAMIESEFNPSARSPVHAVGMWQFMTATARRFGLTVHGHVDERKDPARATDAAVSYLSSLHDRFGSWYLAAAAYNAGEGTVLRALRKVTGRSQGTDEDFFKILPSLPKETQDYVPKLIASARVGADPARYGLTAHPAADVASAAPDKLVVREVVSTKHPLATKRVAKSSARTKSKAKVSRSSPRRSRTTVSARHGRKSATK